MRTTIDLPDALFREVKTRAIQEDKTLKDLVTKYIEAGLRGLEDPLSGHSCRRSNALPVAIERTPGKALTRALSNRELNRLLDHEDLRDGQCPSSES